VQRVRVTKAAAKPAKRPKPSASFRPRASKVGASPSAHFKPVGPGATPAAPAKPTRSVAKPLAALKRQARSGKPALPASSVKPGKGTSTTAQKPVRPKQAPGTRKPATSQPVAARTTPAEIDISAKASLPSRKRTEAAALPGLRPHSEPAGSTLRGQEKQAADPEGIRGSARATGATESAPRVPPPPQPSFYIPPILLEGDEPEVPTPPAPVPCDNGGRADDRVELPQAYGTGRLFLVARDPQWLYAHWDLPPEEQRKYNALAVDRHLTLRVFCGSFESAPAAELHVHPESQHWFVHVPPCSSYGAELGYYDISRRWVSITTCTSTFSLGASSQPAEPQELTFATVLTPHPAAPRQRTALEAQSLRSPLGSAQVFEFGSTHRTGAQALEPPATTEPRTCMRAVREWSLRLQNRRPPWCP
jgi:hypothetical protein